MTGIDISSTFVRHAEEAERAGPLGIRYEVASALDLPFEEASFDFATAFMSRRLGACWPRSFGC